MSTALSDPPPIPATVEPGPRLWTRDEFYRMAEIGMFRGQRTELIEGELMVYSPQGPSHSYCTDRAFRAVDRSGWPGVWVRMQLPIDFGPYSEPEPDVSVVTGTQADYRHAHPTTALLVVEVSDSTLNFDRGRKSSLYAKMGIADYWIVHVGEGVLEVRRDPRPDPSQPHGFVYGSTATLKDGDHVSPVHAPGVRIAMADLLP